MNDFLLKEYTRGCALIRKSDKIRVSPIMPKTLLILSHFLAPKYSFAGSDELSPLNVADWKKGKRDAKKMMLKEEVFELSEHVPAEWIDFYN